MVFVFLRHIVTTGLIFIDSLLTKTWKLALLVIKIQPLTVNRSIVFVVSTIYAFPISAEKYDEDTAIELEALIVKTDPIDSYDLDLLGSHSVIDSDTMERRLMRTLQDVVRYEPGVDIVNDPQRFGQGFFSIRGIGGNRIQMLVDGIRVPEAFSIGTFQSASRNMVDMDALKAVDIVRGANSAVNGSDGIAGTVSFVTKDPRDYLDIFGNQSYQSLKLLYGTAADNFTQTLTLAGALDQWEGLLLFTHSGGAETENKGRDDSLSSNRTAPNPQDTLTLNLLSKLIYRVNEDNALRLSGEVLHNEVHTDVYHLYGLNYTGRTGTHFFTDDRQSRWRISLDQTINHIKWPWLDTLSWQIYGQVSDTLQNVDEGRTTPFGIDEQIKRQFTYRQSMIGGEIRNEALWAGNGHSHHFTYGLEAVGTNIDALRDGSLTNLTTGVVSNRVIPDNFPVRDFPITQTLRGGLFLQDKVELLNQKLELIPALRLDYFAIKPEVDAVFAKDNEGNAPNALDFFEPSPKLGAAFHFNDTFTLHGQYAEGFRAPNFSESNLGFVNFSFGYASIPNAGLKPETSRGVDLGIRADSTFGMFDATFFHTRYNGFIQSVVACDPSTQSNCQNGLLTYQTQNTADEIRIQGFEFKGDLRLGEFTSALENLSLHGGFSYTEGRNLGNDKPISSVSPMNGVLGLRYDTLDERWGGEIILTLSAPKKTKDIDFDTAGNVFPVNGYGIVDVNAYYRLHDHITLTAGVFNLLNKKYSQWQDVRSRGSDPHAGLNGAVDISDRYTRPGINASISLRMEF